MIIKLNIGQAAGFTKLGRTSNPYQKAWQINVARHHADQHVWEFEFDDENPGFGVIKTSSGIANRVLFNKFLAEECLSCSCLDYYQNQLGTCVHLEALRRISKHSLTPSQWEQWRDYRDKIPYEHKNVLYFNSGLHDLNCKFERPYSLAELQACGIELINKKIEVFDHETLFNNNLIRVFDSAKQAILRRKQQRTKCRDEIATQLARNKQLNTDVFQDKGVNLFEYQKEAILHLLQRKRAILALPMGYGKTICSIAAKYIIGKLHNKPIKVLVIAPNTLKTQWADEIKRLLNEEALVVSGKNVEKIRNHKTNWTVANYEIVQRHVEKFEDHYDIIVLDEVQRIRNKETKTWTSINQLNSEYLFTLSGTVIENSISDILSILEILNDDEMVPKWKFYNDHFIIRGEKIRDVKDWNKLRAKFDPYVFRDVSSANMKLPPIHFTILRARMDEEQKHVHNQAYQAAKTLLAISENRGLSFEEKARLNALLLKARQAANSYFLVNKAAIGQPRYSAGEKIKLLTDLIYNLTKNGEKVVVFSEWIEMLELVSKEVNKQQEIKSVMFTGKANLAVREKLKRQFIEDQETKIFYSTDSGGVGVDGLQLACNNVVHCELPWNPARLDQRNGRLHRILQKKEVQVYYVITQASIEEEMIEVSNARKRETRAKALDYQVK